MTESMRAEGDAAAATSLFPSARQFHRRVLACKGVLLACDIAGFLLPFVALRQYRAPAPIVLYQIDHGAVATTQTGLDWYVLLSAAVLIILHVLGFYSMRRGFWDELRFLIQAVLAAAVSDLAILFVSGHGVPLITTVIGCWLLTLLALPVLRTLGRILLRRLDLWGIPTLIIGTGDNALQAKTVLNADGSLGFVPTAFAAIEPNPPAMLAGLPVVPMTGATAAQSLLALDPPHVVVALDEEHFADARQMVDHASHRPNTLDIVPPLRGLPLYGTDVVHLFGQEVLLLRVRNNLARRSPRLVKRVFDIVVSALLLALLSPLFLYLSLRIRREDGGPPFYSQKRVGVGGGEFPCHKFRSMFVNAEAILARWQEEQPELHAEYVRNNFKLREDPRVTRVGRLIRAYSLDELPQLWNVLKGEMSLVGPRPLLAREIPDYGSGIIHYNRVRPGITGLWQISGRSETTFADRAAFDEWYAKNWSLWSDLVILLKTVTVVLGRKGAF